MPDDWNDPNNPTADFNTCLMPIQHELKEYVIDPGSGWFSASRAVLIYYAVGLLTPVIFCMIYFKAWGPLATVIQWTFAPLCGIYAASTWKRYKCNE